MNYFIFQGNPDQFDVDTYITTREEINWLVRQRAKEVNVGDKVFIWRASGKKKLISGVVAVAEVTADPQPMPDDISAQNLWLTGSPNTTEMRAKLKIIKKCIKPKEVVKRDWMVDDPILKDMHIIKSATGTNFLIGASQGERLFDLCMNTGRDWNYEECIAGLWAYKETLSKQVSKLPDSPVTQVALAIGRAVSGVYNKVMNYRAIDPLDQRKGFSSTNNIDHQVWKEFFTGSGIDDARLNEVFTKHWGTSKAGTGVPLTEQTPNERSAYSWTVRGDSVAIKALDKSAFLHHGTGIPISIRSFFLKEEMKPGQKVPIVIQAGEKVFPAHLEMDSQDAPRTRLMWNANFARELQSLFPHHFSQHQAGVKGNVSELFMQFQRVDGFKGYRITFAGEVKQDVISKDIQAEEIEDRGPSREGAVKEYYGKRYERDPGNRRKAISIHGLTCQVCGFNFEEVYGERGADFIEIHHRKPIATFEGEAQLVDPETDLVPLCSNCHRMIHRRVDAVLTLESLKQIYLQLKQARGLVLPSGR